MCVLFPNLVLSLDGLRSTLRSKCIHFQWQCIFDYLLMSSNEAIPKHLHTEMIVIIFKV